MIHARAAAGTGAATGQASKPTLLSRTPLGDHKVCVPLLIVILVVGIALHYGDNLPLLSAAAERTPLHLDDRQSLERILFLLPIIYGSVVLGTFGGVSTLVVAAAAMFPKAVFGPGDLTQSLLQVAGVLATGSLVVVLLRSERIRVQNARSLTQRLMVAQEEERERIARGLHDDIVQAFYVMAQRLDHLASGGAGDVGGEVAAEIRRVREISVQTSTDLRQMLQELRPRVLDDLGLKPALEWLADEFLRLWGMRVVVHADDVRTDLPARTQLLLWRIAQEALNNAARHAHATETVVALSEEAHRIRLRVQDDGQGFDVARAMRQLPRQEKLGIVGMQERARLAGGSLAIDSAPGAGTSVTVTVALAGV